MRPSACRRANPNPIPKPNPIPNPNPNCNPSPIYLQEVLAGQAIQFDGAGNKARYTGDIGERDIGETKPSPNPSHHPGPTRNQATQQSARGVPQGWSLDTLDEGKKVIHALPYDPNPNSKP